MLTDKLAILLGNSGVGKSSLAQAGVIAALMRQVWPEAAEITSAQRDRRARMRRIDYYASPEADAIINRLRQHAEGGDADSIINMIILEWAVGCGFPNKVALNRIRRILERTAAFVRCTRARGKSGRGLSGEAKAWI